MRLAPSFHRVPPMHSNARGKQFLNNVQSILWSYRTRRFPTGKKHDMGPENFLTRSCRHFLQVKVYKHKSTWWKSRGEVMKVEDAPIIDQGFRILIRSWYNLGSSHLVDDRCWTMLMRLRIPTSVRAVSGAYMHCAIALFIPQCIWKPNLSPGPYVSLSTSSLLMDWSNELSSAS